MVDFFVKSNENTYPKGRALMQVYRVVPLTKKRELTLEVKAAIIRVFSIYKIINKTHLPSTFNSEPG